MLTATCGASAISSSRGTTCPRTRRANWTCSALMPIHSPLWKCARVWRGKTPPALPEMSITNEKHEVLVRAAHYFLRKRHIQKCPLRFDVVAIENTPGQPPVVRLHKAAFSPEVPPRFR